MMKGEPVPSDLEPHRPIRGALFGALLTLGLACWFVLVYPKPWHFRPGDIEMYVPRAVLLGALFGATLRHRKDDRRIVAAMLFGPLLVHLALIKAMYEDLWGLLGLPLAMVFAPYPAMLAIPLTLPTAFLVVFFNDPALERRERQIGWLLFVFLLALTGAVGVLNRFPIEFR
jgi:hypothetical protein